MFSMFKNSVKAQPVEAQESLHDESTQRISTKPSLSLLENGKIKCPGCGEEILISDCADLSLSRCPSCGTPNFIPKLIKDYWLYEPLGGGGMGSVYHAFHKTNPKFEFAVKILPRNRKEDKELVNAILNEANIGKQFGRHPHVTIVYDFGFQNNEYFAVYEYIDGIRLDQIIESSVKRPLKQIVLWGMQILSAEQHIFDSGYLFRDLKPQNVMIDRNGNVKLIDYGLAMSVDEARVNNSDEIQGSPYYIPPERITGSGEGQHSEIYSLGMLIFHVLAKQPYYTANDISELMGKHVIALRINNVGGKLPSRTNPAIITIINKMIDRNPNNRYQTYKDVGKDLFELFRECA